LEEFPIVAVSVAYELEIAGLVSMLDAAKIPARRTERDARHPFVLAGGPLTFSNPLPLAGIVDAIIVGESEEPVAPVLEGIRSELGGGVRSASASLDGAARARALERLAAIPHVFVPAHHGAVLPEVAKADNALLPAWSPIRTPHAVLSNMFLIETE